MNLQMIVASRQTQPTTEGIVELQGRGYWAWPHNGRYYVEVPIEDFSGVAPMWEHQLFRLSDEEGENTPDMISVRFRHVTCASVAGMTKGETTRVIMVDPTSPTTRLFNFTIIARLGMSEIEVRMNRVQARNGIEPFLRVLDICAREFYTEGEYVEFNSRRYIGKVRRRYLLWLGREGKAATPAEEVASRSALSAAATLKQTVGKLSRAESRWEHLVQSELALQQGGES